MIQKQLVLVVEDTAGKRAVSFPFRSIKAGTTPVASPAMMPWDAL